MRIPAMSRPTNASQRSARGVGYGAIRGTVSTFRAVRKCGLYRVDFLMFVVWLRKKVDADDGFRTYPRTIPSRRRVAKRATIEQVRTIATSTNAPAHACRCQSSYGEPAYV